MKYYNMTLFVINIVNSIEIASFKRWFYILQMRSAHGPLGQIVQRFSATLSTHPQKSVEQGFLTWGARRGCGDVESLRLVSSTLYKFKTQFIYCLGNLQKQPVRLNYT